ncbi:MAG: S9 family peptidase [Candidatus Kapaibacterium sp.]
MNNLPGNTALPSSKSDLDRIAAQESGTFRYRVEDYFSKPKLSAFLLSPDGRYFSYREKDNHGKSHIYVRNLSSNEITKVVEENEELIEGYWWANNDRLLFIKDQGGNENHHVFGVNIDGSNLKDLTPFENVRARVINELKEQNDFCIVSMNREKKEVFEPYKLNIVTGELEKLYDNPDTINPIMGYVFDKDGILRAITRLFNGTEYHCMYRESNEGPFRTIEKTSWKTAFGILAFNYRSSNPHEAFVVSNLHADTMEIQRYDLKEGKMLEVLYRNDVYDVAELSLSRKRGYEIDYWAYEGEKEVLIPVSEHYTNICRRLDEEFRGSTYKIYAHNDNEDKYLIYVYSDKIVGRVYFYDSGMDTITLVVDTMPHLREEDMATMRPISFISRDGLRIHGYLTIPTGAESRTNPLIVNPHGGPYGPRDSWHFNPETQLFASRGYLTLQVNYRGSGGYGKSFSLAGAKQIGRNMLNDLEDAVAYCIDLGIVDESKIAIYGASYGGLATLGSLVKTPELYRCGIDYVGVSNLFTFLDTIPPYWKPFLEQMHEQWYDPTNPEEREIMKQVSPALNIDAITKPLFIVQGANDPRVNIDESDQVVAALRSKGIDVPYLVKYNEGHGFRHEENRIELYSIMMGFFSQYLK